MGVLVNQMLHRHTVAGGDKNGRIERLGLITEDDTDDDVDIGDVDFTVLIHISC